MADEEATLLLRALLLLLIDERESREPGPQVKTEVLLARAGLGAPAIAGLQGKSLDAVRKTLQRAGAKTSG